MLMVCCLRGTHHAWLDIFRTPNGRHPEGTWRGVHAGTPAEVRRGRGHASCMLWFARWCITTYTACSPAIEMTLAYRMRCRQWIRQGRGTLSEHCQHLPPPQGARHRQWCTCTLRCPLARQPGAQQPGTVHTTAPQQAPACTPCRPTWRLGTKAKLTTWAGIHSLRRGSEQDELVGQRLGGRLGGGYVLAMQAPASSKKETSK